MRARGFSLVEMLITMAILAILIAIAFPSFQGSLRTNRVAGTNNELLASLSLVRSEAIRSVRGGGICASTQGTECDGTWSDGWLVWQDADGGVPASFDDDTDVVVRHVNAREGVGIALTNISGVAVTAVGFDTRGRPVAASMPYAWTLTPGSCPAGSEFVRISEMTVVGQTKSLKGACP
jgi:type IV fimbrial biogenesis protein FimT